MGTYSKTESELTHQECLDLLAANSLELYQLRQEVEILRAMAFAADWVLESAGKIESDPMQALRDKVYEYAVVINNRNTAEFVRDYAGQIRNRKLH